MPECKLCGTELEFDDTLDDYPCMYLNKITVKQTGHCPKCNKSYIWNDIYQFNHYEDLEECE